jgi:hypothetical protein
MTRPTLTYPRIAYYPQGQGYSYFTPSIRAALKRAAAVQLTIWPGWGSVAQMNDVIGDLRNGGKTQVQQYTVMSEISATDPAQADLRAACDANSWWLRDTGGHQVGWSNTYGAWDVNPTDWTAVDGNGDRYPQWLAKRWAATLAGAFPDCIKIDNAFTKARELYYNPNTSGGTTFTQIASNINNTTIAINWDGQGTARNNWDALVASKLRQAYAAYVAALRTQFPGLDILANVDSAAQSREYMGLFDAVEQEGLVGQPYGIYSSIAGLAAMQRYKTVMTTVRKPWMNILKCGAPDMATMRLGLCFTLMDDGIYAGPAVDVTQPDEFMIDLGRAADAPQYAARENGGWRRDFEKGVVFLNPTGSQITMTPPPGLKRIAGTADPTVNNGAALGSTLTLAANSGLIALRA